MGQGGLGALFWGRFGIEEGDLYVQIWREHRLLDEGESNGDCVEHLCEYNLCLLDLLSQETRHRLPTQLTFQQTRPARQHSVQSVLNPSCFLLVAPLRTFTTSLPLYTPSFPSRLHKHPRPS